jgi:hypothetical protein
MRALNPRSPHPLFPVGCLTNRGSGEAQRRQPRTQGVSVLASPNAKDRLDSWKEIASYLKRTVRTVQRWERHEGLPIHRHLHRRANSVYAHKSELDDWWNREARSIEVDPLQPLSQAARPKVAISQGVNAVCSKRACGQTDPTAPEWFIECVLELRAVALCSSGEGSGRSVSVFRVRIPVLDEVRSVGSG